MSVHIRRLLVVLLILLVVGVPLLHRVSQDLKYRNLHMVQEGVLLRSGQMNREGFERVVRERGVRTVISFRETMDNQQVYEDAFEEEICRDAGVKYHRFSYLDYSGPDGAMPVRANIDKFLKLMDDSSVPKPVLIHCFAGIHRTGVHAASYRVERQGWSPEEAWEELQTLGSRRTKYGSDFRRFVFTLNPQTVGGPSEKP